MTLRNRSAAQRPYPRWMLALSGLGALSLLAVVISLFFTLGRRPQKFQVVDAPPAASMDFLRSIAGNAAAPLRAGGSVHLLDNGAFFDALLRAIADAKRTINFTVYIWEAGRISDQVFAALTQRARDGVEVRVLLDGLGCMGAPDDAIETLRSAGGKVETFRSPRLGKFTRFHKRSHRRAIVMDGMRGFTGGSAIADKWLGDASRPEEWRDFMVEASGPPAATLQSAFVAMWAHSTGEILSGPGVFPPGAQEPRAAGEPVVYSVGVASSPSSENHPLRLFYYQTQPLSIDMRRDRDRDAAHASEAAGMRQDQLVVLLDPATHQHGVAEVLVRPRVHGGGIVHIGHPERLGDPLHTGRVHLLQGDDVGPAQRAFGAQQVDGAVDLPGIFDVESDDPEALLRLGLDQAGDRWFDGHGGSGSRSWLEGHAARVARSRRVEVVLDRGAGRTGGQRNGEHDGAHPRRLHNSRFSHRRRDDDQQVVAQLVAEYYTAYAREDLDRLLGLWSPALAISNIGFGWSEETTPAHSRPSSGASMSPSPSRGRQIAAYGLEGIGRVHAAQGDDALALFFFERSLPLYETRATRPTWPAWRAGSALRSAALTLLDDNRYRHPFYWAGFVIVGDGS